MLTLEDHPDRGKSIYDLKKSFRIVGFLTQKNMDLRMRNRSKVFFAALACIWLAGCKKTEVIDQTKTIIQEVESSSKSPEYVITKYGAKGDGVTDCSKIINDLIAGLPASGGTIVIPEGEFFLNSPITVNKNFVTIKGLNPGLRSNVDVTVSGIVSNPGGGSKLILGGSSTGIEVPTIPDVNGRKNRISGLSIKNLLITGGSSSKGVGINILQDNDGVRIEDVIGINLIVGIKVNAADAMIIRNCWVSECRNSIEMTNGIQNMITNCQLGAQPGGITLKLTNQENFSVTSNQIYPDGDVNVQLNNCTYGNISSNNIQSYYVGMIELNEGSFNLINGNTCWMRLPGNPAGQLRGKTNDYGAIRISGTSNLVSNNMITCNWPGTSVNPVTIRSASGSNNTYSNNKISDITSSRVFYVNENNEIFNTVPSSKVFVDGDASKVYVRY